MAATFVLTPPGTGAIGVVRLIGADAASLLERVFRPKGSSVPLTQLGNRLCYGWIIDDGQQIDDVILSHSKYGETPAFDVSMHGGIRVVERILGLFDRMGASLLDSKATGGCFWPAATAIERDCVAALSAAKTERAVRFLAGQRRLLPEALHEICENGEDRPEAAAAILTGLIGRYAPARVLIEGARVSITGPPNVGKSTLFNALVGRTAAVVSDRAGTTRDWVSAPIEMDGIPLTLIDTAGKRAAADTLERQAIEATSEISHRAAVRLLMFDAASPPEELDDVGGEKIGQQQWILVLNKLDLGIRWDVKALQNGTNSSWRFVAISAKSGTGLALLSEAIMASLGFVSWDDKAPAIFAANQLTAIKNALAVLGKDPGAAARVIKRELLDPPESIIQ